MSREAAFARICTLGGVAEALTVDSGADHVKLQLDRLAPAEQLGAEAIAAGDISAIDPYLKALDRLDRYQSVAGGPSGL